MLLKLSSDYDAFCEAWSQSRSLLGFGLSRGHAPAALGAPDVQTEPPQERDGEARPQRRARRLENLPPRPAARRARSRERNPIQPARFIHPMAPGRASQTSCESRRTQAASGKPEARFARRYAPGAVPTARLKALLNAASDS